MSEDLTEKIQQYHALMQKREYAKGYKLVKEYNIPWEDQIEELRRIRKQFKHNKSELEKYEKSMPNDDIALLEILEAGG